MTSGKRAAQGWLWLALTVGTGFVGWRAYEGVQETRRLTASKSLAAAAGADRDFECLHNALRSLVPVGAKVYLDLEGLMSLTALAAAFPDREVVRSADESEFIFGLTTPSASRLCDGGFRATPAPERL